MTALIDGDAIIYIVAWHNKDNPDFLAVDEGVDSIVNGILQSVNADAYLGALGHATEPCFRYKHAKYKPYKGTRGPKDEHVVRLEPQIRARLMDHWGFIECAHIEADDIICAAAELHIKNGQDFIICSPDKDLRQIPGKHFDYKKNEFLEITPEMADYLFYMQMLTGDDVDNVAGLPGIGPKKAEAALATTPEDGFHEQTVRNMYNKYFGPYYGNVIFEENKTVLGLLHSTHKHASLLTFHLEKIVGAVKTLERPGL